MYLYTHRRPVDLNYYEYYYFAMLIERASTELFPASNPCQHDHWTKSHAMLTPAIAQRSANLGVTIIKKKMYVTLSLAAQTTGVFLSFVVLSCLSLSRPFAIGSDRLTANPPLPQFVSAALERSRGSWGSNHVQYLHFCLRGKFFFPL